VLTSVAMPVEAHAIEADIARALDRGDYAGSATVAIRGYGPQILGYLSRLLHDEGMADEVFSSFCEDLWKSISGFRRECSFRTWAYKLAWHAAVRFQKSPHRRRVRRLGTTEASALAAEVRTTTALELRDEAKDHLTELRSALTQEEQTLLILRVDRAMTWTEVADVMSAEDDKVDEAALRKRFERIKEKLRAKASVLRIREK
jgi:RNA polymerase sigma-70 factor, ECF subfamily